MSINLAVQGSTLYSQQKLLGQESILEDSEVSTHQYDFAITGVKDLAFENGSILSPFMSIGVHGEKIIEDSINGMEYRSGFEFNTPTGFSIASTGNLLLDQIDHIYRWTLSSTLDFDPNQDQEGVMIQVSSFIGDSSSLNSDNMASQYSPL